MYCSRVMSSRFHFVGISRRSVGLLLAVALCGTFGACSSTSKSASATAFGTPEPIELPVPAGDDHPGVASIAWSGKAWFAAGSFHDAEGQHHPGLWTSADSVHWSRIETVPVTYYGKISEIYSVAASARGVVAIGAATGGFHANPRTVSWILRDDGMLHEVPANFELYNGIRQISVRTVADGPAGWVIIGSRVNQNGQIGATSWTSSAGDDFAIHDDDPALSSSNKEQIFGFDVTQAGEQEIAVGEHTAFGATSGETDGIAWSSPDGVAWTPWTPAGLDLGGPGTQRLNRISSSGKRVLIAGTQSDRKRTTLTAWTTIDGKVWHRVTVAPFGTTDDVLSSATATETTPDEFIIAARMGNGLHLAMSPDGIAWTEFAVADDLPTGNRAVLSVASNAGTLLVGATSLEGGGLWRSTKS
jgi:hypothetical protein